MHKTGEYEEQEKGGVVPFNIIWHYKYNLQTSQNICLKFS